MKFIYKKNGKSIIFELGKTYYMADWYPGDNRNMLPVIVELLCIRSDDDENEGFILKEIKNIIPSLYPAKSYQHPNEIGVMDWDKYFHKTIKDAYKMFYKEYKNDPKYFFDQMFGEVR